MKVILPLAGLGTRLRPHTFSRPKPLITVAGKPVLGHILDQLAGLDISEILYIIGHLGDQIVDYVGRHYPQYPARFVEQRELKGQAHALWLASAYITEPVLIIFVDTLVEADLRRVTATETDGVILVKEVEDPRRFGVAVLQDGYVQRLVEKPQTPVSNLAVVGVYYIRNYELFLKCLGELIDRGIMTGGEYYLADALQLMIGAGARLRAFPVEIWEDTGTVEALLQTNRYLLAHGHGRIEGELEHSVIVPPVYIARTARLINAVVGPNVSVDDGAVITNAIVREAIINEGARVQNVLLTHSLIGNKADIQGKMVRLNVGDYSQVATE